MYTPKARMLNAYRGVFSDHYPVAPEFWCYYPARLLGVTMVELQREIPLWKALHETFKKFGCEGWANVRAVKHNPLIKKTSSFKDIGNGMYRLVEAFKYKNEIFEKSTLYSIKEPSSTEVYPVDNEKKLDLYIEADLNDDVSYSFTAANKAYDEVGEDYLLEFCIGEPFFDYIAFIMGFQEALFYFIDGDDMLLRKYFERYVESKRELVLQAIQNTNFESYFISCSYSCNSLIGPGLWRKWDKLFIKEMADILHKHGKLLHIHFHGKCMETLKDFVETGVDCVCPFERFPGDVIGLEGLKKVREELQDKVTMNGNVHTVEALLKGTPEDVRQQVREIKEAFAGSPRLIIGTGDQVCGGTPEENLYAMIDEGRKK